MRTRRTGQTPSSTHLPPTPRHGPGRPFPDRSPTYWSGDLYEPTDRPKAKPRRLPDAMLAAQSRDRVADPTDGATALGPYPGPRIQDRPVPGHVTRQSTRARR